MISPKRTKYRKPHRGYAKGRTIRGNRVLLGDYGVQSIEPGLLTSRQVEASRRVITRYVRRTGNLWIRVFPDKAITQRPSETRIGSGKGSLEYWVAPVRPGKIIFEIEGISKSIARHARRVAASKFPVKTRFVVNPRIRSRYCLNLHFSCNYS